MLPFSNDDEERIKMVIYFDTIIQDITLSKQVEQSIYNYIIRLSKEKNIQRRWTNQTFKRLYHSKIIRFERMQPHRQSKH